VEICEKLPFFGRRIVRAALSSVKAATAVSQRTLDGISSFFTANEWGEIEHKFRVIPMGIHLPLESDIFQPKRNTESDALTGKKTLLFMGRFVKKKGIHTLLKAIRTITIKDPTVILVLAGTGPLAKEIKRWISELKLERNVILPGFITQETKEYYLRIARLYILPSINITGGDREGLPVSLLEAMSYKKICIATTESGAEEVIRDNINGYLCDAGHEKPLVQKIELALAASLDETQNMAALARAKAEEYSWKNITQKQYEHFFT